MSIIMIVAGLLVLAIIAEAGFYFYSKSKTAQLTPESEGTTPASTSSLNYEKASLFLETMDVGQGYAQFFKEASMRYSLQGIVKDAYPEDIRVGNIDYNYTFVLLDENGVSIKNRVTSQEMALAKVYEVYPDGRRVGIKIEDIKPGDFLTIEATADLLESENRFDLVLSVSRK
jgi:hypothetical protein